MRTNSVVGVWNRALLRIGQTKLIESEDENTPAAEAASLSWGDVLEHALEEHHWQWATRERQITNIDSQAQTWLYAEGADPWTTWDVPFPFVDTDQVTVTHIGTTGTETPLVAGTDYSFPEVTEGQRATVLLAVGLAADESLLIAVTTTREGWDHVYSLPADCVTPIDLLYDTGGAVLLARGDRNSYAIALNDAGDGWLLLTDLAETDFNRLRYVARVENIGAMPGVFVDALVCAMASELALALPKDTKVSDYWAARYREAVATAIDKSTENQVRTDPESPGLAARG